MTVFQGRWIGRVHNLDARACSTLMGIATGLLADRVLSDVEVGYLRDWLKENEQATMIWPGDVLAERVTAMLADGVITEQERSHLVETLQKIAGGDVERFNKEAVNQLAFDGVPPPIVFSSATFCVTGDFVYGPRDRVHAVIVERGGVLKTGVSKKLAYLIVGLRGSDEWKHGSFGTKIEKAMEIRRMGVPLRIVREDSWSAALKGA